MTAQPGVIRDDYAGPGGWSMGLHLLGLDDIGVEWDEWACRTRRAAGLPTIRADLASWSSPAPIWGYIASPPCQTFSSAGKKAGRAAIGELVAAVADLGAGRGGFARHMRTVARAIRDDLAEQHPTWTRQQRSTLAWEQTRNAVHVVRPMRVIHDHRPEWICLEQVPAVLPIWEAYARALRTMGYSVWCGKLNAADYGVPQTRVRAILIASRVRTVTAPPPTHERNPQPTLFGELRPWVSMAEALGWNGHVDTRRAHGQLPTDTGSQQVATTAPAPVITGKSGGQWQRTEVTVSTGQQTNRHDRDPANAEPYERSTDEPAPTVTGTAAQWQVGRPGHRLNPGKTSSQPNRRMYDPETEPAPTVAFGHDAASWQWEPAETPVLISRRDSPGWVDEHGERANRTADEPAPTFTGEAHRWCWENPAPTVTGGGAATGGAEPFANARQREKVMASLAAADDDGVRTVPSERWVRGEADDPEWPASRPATTIAGDPRVAQPGHKNDKASPDSPGRMQGAIRLELAEALVLQSFPADHPVQGPRTAQFLQVGNAVPPVLSMHCAAAASGWPLPPLD